MGSLGRFPKIEIGEQKYTALLQAWNTISTLVDIEELWECLIQNYIELELEMLKEATNSMAYNHMNYDEFQDMRVAFARRLSNYLSSCRGYINQVPQKIRQVSGDKSVFVNLENNAYDKFFGYRFMEALRNFSQHGGLPVHSATVGLQWIQDEKDTTNRQSRHSVTAKVGLEPLRKSSKFKRSLLEELDSEEKYLPIPEPLREHIEGLGEIHIGIRDHLKEQKNESCSLLRGAIEEYKTVYKESVLSLRVGKFEGGKLKESSPLFEDFFSRVEKKIRKYGSMKNATKRFVTNQIKKK